MRPWALMLGVAVVAACAAIAPSVPSRMYRVGFLSGSSQSATADSLATFLSAARDLGYIEGRHLVVEARWADGYTDRVPALASELVTLGPDVLLALAFSDALALKQATSTIPIILAGVADPVDNGLVASLAHPGGNITGAARRTAGTAARRVQLLSETVLGVSRLGYIYDPSNAAAINTYQEARAEASLRGLELVTLAVRAPDDFAGALGLAATAHLGAMYVGGGPVIRSQQARVLEFLATNRIPSVFQDNRDWIAAGGLMLYAEDQGAGVRKSAVYLDRILRGAKPGELPIEVVSKYNLVINLKTAAALGITIPRSILDQATEVIQ